MKKTLLGLVIGSLLVSCSSTPDPAAKSFNVNNSSASIGQGSGSATYLWVNRINDYQPVITMSVTDLPAGISVEMPVGNQISSGTSTLPIVVNAASTVPAGTYKATVNGTAEGLTKTAALNISVGAPSTTPGPVPTPTPNHPRFPHGFNPPCLSPYLIKGNLSSSGERIYHVPGGAYYNATKPEVCFITEADARADGFRKSSR